MKETYCPLCEAPMDYKTVGESEEKTHAWICRDCPGILFEFYDMNDVINLESHLQKPWHEQD